VLAAGGGRRALHLLEGQGAAIRAVLLDLTMPDMDGVQVCGEIRRRWPGVPVIISSGYSEHEVMPRFADQSGVDFVQKPFGYDTLTQVMRKALEPEGSPGTATPGGTAAPD
jgi:two-component system cell cycle sensor histidine kinase/response regulator CckA